MPSTSLANLMRDLEMRKKNMEEAQQGVVKMYNPEKKFGFVRLFDKRDIHFKLETVLYSGFASSDLVLGAKVNVIVWQIQHIGPEIKRFLTLEKPAPKVIVPPPKPVVALPPPTPTPKPGWLSPPEDGADLDDEFGLIKRKRLLYPGGTEQLVIDHLAKIKISTRDELTKLFVKTGYSAKSLQSSLSRVHQRGWFIENGGKIYFRQGRPPEKTS